MKKFKIAFTGPESSGKTTMAMWASEYLSCEMISEYAREYLSGKTHYTIDDLNKIAKEQFKRNASSGTLILDTEMLVMKIWCEEKYNTCSKHISSLLMNQNIEFYFLCKPDIPWVDDPLRENANDRVRLFDLYEKNLNEQGFDFLVLKGSLEERKQTIIKILQKYSWA